MLGRGLTWILPVLLATSAPAKATEIHKDFHRRFDVREGNVLRLQHGDGDVEIEPWDQSVLDVTVRYRAEVTKIGLGGEPDFDVEFHQEGDTVHVIGKESGGGAFVGFRSKREYEHLYTVRAPAWLRLDLEGEDGNVRIRDWHGKVRCRTEDGTVRVEGLQAGLDLEMEDGSAEISRCKLDYARIRSEDGPIRVEDCEGSFDIRSQDGAVALERTKNGTLIVRTEDGAVSVDLPGPTAPQMDVQTEDGSVRVALGRGVSATFTIETDEGNIRVDLPAAEKGRTGEHEASGVVGDGEGRIRISTEDGRVSLEESLPAAK